MRRNLSVSEVRRDREEMAKKKNQILVEWLKSKDAGERNCVNVKHVVGDAESIIVGGIVSVKFNA